jgi:type IX secretion system PorP/SprF family membrane protein
MEYTAPPAHQGIGFTIINDKTGPLNRIAAYASYAYHLPVGVKTSLSAGVSIGAQEITLDVSKLDFGTANPVDPVVYGSGYLNKFRPDFNAGLWLSSTDFFIGLSALQIIPQPIDYSNQTISGDSIKILTGSLIPHFFLSAGYKMMIDENFSLLPSVMVSYVQPVPVTFDINCKVQYQDLVWIGASYRYNSGFAAMLGLNISSTINLGYSYDYTTSALNTVSSGSHEIVLGFLLRKSNPNYGSRR